MTKKDSENDNAGSHFEEHTHVSDGSQQQSPDRPHVGIGVQYVKDLSFENPKAPASLLAGQKKPKIELAVDCVAAHVQDQMYEVSLHINAQASVEEDIIFICEINYAGLFTLFNIKEEHKEQALMVHAPNLLFPFARRIIADTTRDGGFPTLTLDPVDFAHLYQQKRARAVSQNQSTDDN